MIITHGMGSQITYDWTLSNTGPVSYDLMIDETNLVDETSLLHYALMMLGDS